MILKDPDTPNDESAPAQHSAKVELDHRLNQLLLLAKALANEIDALQAELNPARSARGKISDREGIDFYEEVERYEIELIRRALEQCGGNQTHAAVLLHMKSTTLNAKMKHYGLHALRSPMRSFATQRPTTST
jgi:DNA-binding NtrC family response regulator